MVAPNRLLRVLLFFSLFLIAFLIYFRITHPPAEAPHTGMYIITFNNQTPLRVTVARSEAERVHGLSDTDPLKPNDGMFFIFPEDGFQGIWMKDMRYPIDIIWLDSRGEIVDLRKNVTPDTFPTIFEPMRKARYVIEASAHYTDTWSIKIGDMVQVPKEVLPEGLQK